MKLFSLIQMKYTDFESAVRSYLSKTLTGYNEKYGSNTIFGQLINVMTSSVQNMLSYIEDSLTEQNKYTAERKKSIYNLAAISGYVPSLGTTTTAYIRLAFKPNTSKNTNIILSNRTRLRCVQNGLIYNIILPQETIILSLAQDNSNKFLTIVEGMFETQEFISGGGQLWTQNVSFTGDVDIDYLRVFVNEEEWERRESLYDMDPDGKQYCCMTSLKKGIDLVFGNEQYGRKLNDGDVIRVEYLLHGGEMGAIDPDKECDWAWEDHVQDTNGNDIDPATVFDIYLMAKENISSGTYSESLQQVAKMIGYNSRALVLADAKNYKLFFNRYSFVGYNRTWTERGSLVVNSLVLRNFAKYLKDGNDYFSLDETDFVLSDTQKLSLQNAIAASGQQLSGTVFNIFDPELVKYAMYVYVKPKTTNYNKEYVMNNIRKLVGEFFSNVSNDMFIPKSDIIKLLKDNIKEIDGVNIYFISERNEQAIKDKQYTDKTYIYNMATGTYDIRTEEVYLYDNENPGLGLDSHGNILLENNEQFPVLMGGWSYNSTNSNQEHTTVTVTDPLTIIFE